MEVDSTINLSNFPSFQFTSLSEIKVRVNEENKKIDIKYHSGMYKGRMFNNQRFLFGVDVKEQEYGPTSDEFDV